VIVGAGPAGLGAAYRLRELGIDDYVVLEASDHVGGLATSYRDEQNFTWDIGGHVQFSHYRYFDAVMDRALGVDGWNHLNRESWVWIRQGFVPYPFQNNLRHLPAYDLARCLLGLVRNRLQSSVTPPENFQEWIHQSFGAGIASVFMEPYNLKVWGYPPAMLSHEWVGERVAAVDLTRILSNIIRRRDDVSWGPNNRFRFPKTGGTGSIWERVGDLCGRERIRLNCEVTSVSARDRTVRTSAGDTVSYDALLSTMPVDRLCRIIEDLDPSVRALSTGLRYSTSNIMGVGITGVPPEHLRTKCWMYFPESDCPFYRVTVFSNYSAANVAHPGQQWSLMAEVSESPHKPVNAEQLQGEVLDGLRRTRLLPEKAEVVSVWQYRAAYGYPTPSIGRTEILERIHTSLDALAIFSRGRFGGWKYEVSNQDHTFMQGVEWVNRMIEGVPELTLFHPHKANGR
jgi:protoporphyrinogen oxidase